MQISFHQQVDKPNEMDQQITLMESLLTKNMELQQVNKYEITVVYGRLRKVLLFNTVFKKDNYCSLLRSF